MKTVTASKWHLSVYVKMRFKILVYGNDCKLIYYLPKMTSNL